MHTRTCTDPRQGRTQTIAHLSACIICVGCCSMQCNCAEGLHFSAFHSLLFCIVCYLCIVYSIVLYIMWYCIMLLCIILFASQFYFCMYCFLVFCIVLYPMALYCIVMH